MTTPKEKIKKQLEANKNLKKKILSLKGIRGDKPTKITPARKPKSKKPKTTGSLLKEVGNIFAKDDDTSYDTYEDIISEDAFGNLDSFYPSGSGSFTSGFEGFDASGGFKKGGRLKNAGKRKRAALRGQRSELRGS